MWLYIMLANIKSEHGGVSLTNSYILDTYPSREHVQLKYYYGVDKQILPNREENKNYAFIHSVEIGIEKRRICDLY